MAGGKVRVSRPLSVVVVENMSECSWSLVRSGPLLPFWVSHFTSPRVLGRGNFTCEFV